MSAIKFVLHVEASPRELRSIGVGRVDTRIVGKTAMGAELDRRSGDAAGHHEAGALAGRLATPPGH